MSWLLLLHVFWLSWQAMLLGGTLLQLNKQAVDINNPTAEIAFQDPEKEYGFADTSSATVPVHITLADDAKEQIDVVLRAPAQWFDETSPRTQIAAGKKSGIVELRFSRLPTPGNVERVELEFADIPGRVRVPSGSKHVINIRNSRLPKADLIVKSPAKSIPLREPIANSPIADSNVSLELSVNPPRSARVAIRLEGGAKPNVDYRVVGEQVTSIEGQYFVSIPSRGSTLVRVEALHNPKELNRDPKSLQVTFDASATDPELSVDREPLVLQIANSDRVHLRIIPDADLNLYESNTKKEVVLKLEPLSDVPSPTELSFMKVGSPGLVDGDIFTAWEPSAKLLGSETISLRIGVKDDSSPERTESVTIRFPDGADYEIEGPREFVIPVHDDDRKLTAGVDSVELLEGNEAHLELKFDPPDDAVSTVDFRLSKGNSDRFALLEEDGRAVNVAKDAQGRAKYSLRAPGRYRISMTGAFDNDRLDPVEQLEFEFMQTAIPQFQIPPSPLPLTLRDDDSQGNVLLIVACTKYVRQRVEPGRAIDPIFRQRFNKIRQLGATNQLVGRGVFFVGRSKDARPSYLLWKGAVDPLGEFAARHAFVSPNDDAPDCLVDCLQGVSDLVRLHRQGIDPALPLQVIVVWPSDEEPRFDACVANKAPKNFGENTTCRFVWLGDVEGQVGKTFGPIAPIDGMYELFPRQESTLAELPETSDQTLAAKIVELLGNSPAP